MRPTAVILATLIGTAAPQAGAITDQYALGTSFTVAIDVNATSVEVVNSAAASHRTFVSASTGLTTISQSSGNFELNGDTVGAPAQKITIGGVTSSSQSVEISGSFGDSDWNWTLAFSLDSDHSQALLFDASVDGSDVANVYLAYESHPKKPSLDWVSRLESETFEVGVYPSGPAKYAGGSLLTTYTAVASLTSSLGRWIVLDGTSYALFNLASNATSPFKDTAQSFLAGDIIEGDHSNSSSTTVEIQYEGPSISGWLGRVTGGNALLEATGALTNVTGRQPTLPDWVNDGAILGIQGGQEFVETVIQDAQNASLPLVSVWLQDWSGTRLQAGTYGIDVHRLWWNWEPDTTLYPTWAEWVPYLREHYDVRTLSYVNTFLANLSTKSTGFNTNFYDIAKREGRYVTNTTAGDGSVWT
ncbi:hypothetical protein PI124_g21610 [Phytophthora idaei]|nr:hypothetical protein PI125_g25187 [Phytophthora idaei]KAG3233312.1 hypothetical protein PI124_g21610 [Phytophthora idaei]